jgi:hypothetical protein
MSPSSPSSPSSPGSDRALVASCASIIDVPKDGPPDSFVLHAPLELLARAILLERLPDERRARARERLQWLADRYAAAGPTATAPAPSLDAPVDDVLCSLAAAGHAPILLSLRGRVPAVTTTFGDASIATEIARNAGWKLTWPRARRTSGRTTSDLEERLAAPRSPGDPGNDFIYPTMQLTESSGLAAEVLEAPLSGLRVDEARRMLLRTAARSMLQDNPAAAPYGWTHCLTLPQAVLVAADRGADPDIAVAVAATYVLGFRATQGKVRLDASWTPPPEPSPEVVEALVEFGVTHADAHVAKYTLACLDAADTDPEGARLYLAAAAHLQDWWRQHDLRAAG